MGSPTGRNEGHGKRCPIVLPWLQKKPFAQEKPTTGRPRHHLQNWLTIILANNRGKQVHEAPSAPSSNAQPWKPASSSRFLMQTCQQKQWPFFSHILGLGLWVTKEGGGNTAVRVVTLGQVDSPICSDDFGVAEAGPLSPLVQKSKD